jgi:hypothetical protein
MEWHSLLISRNWNKLTEFLTAICFKPGQIYRSVAEALSEMSRQIQKIEAGRVLRNRAERSHMAKESQQIQEVIDTVLFRCYGLSENDAEYIEHRLKEML